MNREEARKIALGLAYLSWAEDHDEYDDSDVAEYWEQIADKCERGTLTDEERAELQERHELVAKIRGENWYEEIAG